MSRSFPTGATLRTAALLSAGMMVGACASGTGSVQSAPAAAPMAANASSAPTYYEHVLPIVVANCVDCHQAQGKNMGGMVAPMAYTSYEDTAPWARVMAIMVEQRKMPPWDAHRMHEGTFLGERYLTDQEIGTIVDWADAGAPAGDPANAPAGLLAGGQVEAQGGGEWWIGEPDLVLNFAEPFHVPDEIRDLNIGVNLVVPREQHSQPRWIKASEMRAGSSHVHHICGEPFGCIAPGWDPYVYPPGYAMLLPVVDELRLGMHYNKVPGEGTGFDDTSRAAMIFYEDGDTIEHMVRRSVLSVGEDFVIPAGHPEFSLRREFEFEEDSYILSLTPHMHYRGKRAKYELIHPDGSTELLLYVPEYDFEWQRMYVFREPKVAPAGSTLIWTPTWDNSSDNPYNPDATVDVPYGAPTEMEMGNGWLDYTPIAPIHHIVGQDEVPQDLLDQVTRYLEASAERESVPVIDGVRQEQTDATETNN